MKVLAASCVDWMDLKDTVFGGVPPDDLKTWCDDVRAAATATPRCSPTREAFTTARRPGAPAVPVPLLLRDPLQLLPRRRGPGATSRTGTAPAALKATAAPGELIENRARNAAHKLDRLLDGFLAEFERARGRAPARRLHRRPRRGVPAEGAHRPRLGGDERADPRAGGLARARACRRASSTRRRATPTSCRRCSRCSATTTRPSLYADGLSMFDARRRTGSSSRPSAGSRSTRRSARTSR